MHADVSFPTLGKSISGVKRNVNRIWDLLLRASGMSVKYDGYGTVYSRFGSGATVYLASEL